jgi:hypothetical protein
MNGHVRTEELNTNKLEAGAVVVLFDKERIEIVTIQHINPAGEWIVMGQGFEDYAVPHRAELCRLVIVTTSGTYPLKFNQWTNAIKSKEVNDNRPVQFELIPQKFKYGKYIRVCQTCTAQFMGGRSQPACETCCTKNVTAQITVKKKSVITKRPRIKSTVEIKALALTSFQMGSSKPHTTDEIKTFNKWLDKQF